MLKTLLCGILLPLACCLGANEIGFIETYALADDRAATLESLIPGTDDYYYFHALHYQQTKQRVAYEDTLKKWATRFPKAPRLNMLRDRQALLDYAQDPQAALKHVRETLGLNLNHQGQAEDGKLDLPVKLDPTRIAFNTLLEQAFKDHPESTGGLEDAGLLALNPTKLSQPRKRDYLRRLTWPVVPGLAKIIAEDAPHSKGFGSDRIHQALLEDQLIELARLDPKTAKLNTYIEERLECLKPNSDVDLSRDRPALAAYLDRLDTYVSTLEPGQNPLKATVLYRKLILGQQQGQYDAALFKRYLEIPRANGWEVETKEPRQVHPVNLNATYGSKILVEPIGGDDRDLIRDYLEHLLIKAPNPDAYRPFIKDTLLNKIFAETKILHGIGNPEQWASLLSPQEYEAIKHRVEIRFAATNQEVFSPKDTVSLAVDVKHVNSLLIKVFTINTYNYYREHLEEIHTGLDLDGLTATHERVVDLSREAMERRMRKTFDFPELNQPGTYIIDLIGNGINSRALIIKGRLGLIEEITADGQAFAVLDAGQQLVKKASIWMGGRTYESNKQGLIVLPFTTQAKEERIILQGAGLTTLARFNHVEEVYDFRTGFYVDREALLRYRKATVLVRPHLEVAGARMSVAEIENPRLEILSRTHEGIESTREEPIQLHNQGETPFEFRVPERLAYLRFTLKGKIRNRSRNKDEDLSLSEEFTLNGIDTTAATHTVLVTHEQAGYVAELRGRNGETLAGQGIHIELKHHLFTKTVHLDLQTDAEGRAHLGPLGDITWFHTRSPSGIVQRHVPQRDRILQPIALHGIEQETLRVAVLPGESATLLSHNHGRYRLDLSKQVLPKNGYAEITGLGAGDYELTLLPSGVHIPIRITRGVKQLGKALSPTRALDLPELAAAHITGITLDGKQLVIQLGQTNRLTRVHLLVNRYLPEYDLFSQLSAPSSPAHAMALRTTASLYLSGRAIGDEHQYILDRQLAQKYPGQLLTRPGLLLNPWALKKTEQDLEDLERGDALLSMQPPASPAPKMAPRFQAAKDRAGEGGPMAFHNNLDFLKQASILAANLLPDAQGRITIPLEELASHPQVQVLLLGPGQAELRHLRVPHQAAECRELRLAGAFKPDLALSEQRKVSVLQKGQAFTIDDLSTSKMERFESLADVYRLYMTLQPLESFVAFGFILNWPDLEPEAQRVNYAKYASHELNLFLYFKDRPFFDQVIHDYLRNKKEKTFIDYWLLGEDLSAFAEPWAFGRLNAVERLLLAQRLPNRADGIRRHEHDLGALQVVLPEQVTRRFDTALATAALFSIEREFELLEEMSDVTARITVQDGLGISKGMRWFDSSARGVNANRTRALAKTDKASALNRPSSNKSMEGEIRELDGDGLSDRGLEKLPALGRLFRSRDATRKMPVAMLFLKLKPTSEWAENNYYYLPVEQQTADLILTNPFWQDFAAHEGVFLSEHLAAPTSNLAEMMLALALIDLPFKAGEHTIVTEERRFTITPAHPIIVFHQEIRKADIDADAPVMVNQLFLRSDDRTHRVGNETVEQPVTEEFLRRVVYTGKITVTNPTARKRALNLLLQIPAGAIPVNQSLETRGVPVVLEPYSTQSVEIDFYFPEAGEFSHYPVHVAQDGIIVARAEPFRFTVVEKLSKVDETSWAWLSQYGTLEQVITFLEKTNIEGVNVNAMAWRMKDPAAYTRVMKLLADRHVFNPTLCSYALMHNDLPIAREFLKHSAYPLRVGAIDSPLLTTDWVAMHRYQHLEYAPLVNPRVHPVGKDLTILNHPLRAQYQRFMQLLSQKAALDDEDRLAVAYYLALQDRIEEALTTFAQVPRDTVASKLQHDYLRAYLGMYEARLDQARGIAESYKSYPAPRWRNRFLNILAQLDESGKPVDPENREQAQEALAATAPALDFTVDGLNLMFDYQAIAGCTLNFYPMDLELLFSRNPFLADGAGPFSTIRPVLSREIDLPADQNRFTYALPPVFRRQNVMVEVLADGIRRSQPALANELNLQLISAYGQLNLRHAVTAKPISRAYVKVYARMNDGQVKFFKDGYTDFRGRFDYVSLNTGDLENVQRFALLIMSEENGATIKEIEPPKR
ncbi:MAG: hypothetical protein ACI9TH_002064 [Kiritimatiellia bacterium]|jgi:hypothetical protein